MAADHVYKMDYRQMLAYHLKNKADVTIAVSPVSLEIAPRFGILTAGDDSRISEFQEKPAAPESNLASMGIYIFKKSVLAQRLSEDAGSPGSVHDFGHSIIPRMVELDRAFAYRFSGYWRDIGTVKAYYDANMDMMENPSYLDPHDKWPVFTFSRYEPVPVGALSRKGEGKIDEQISSRKIPKRIQGLNELAFNLWWSWHPEARQLFKSLDRSLWKSTSHNPVKTAKPDCDLTA